MDEAEQRQLARDSLFVMADLRLDGSEGEHRVKVRNLSSGGMMAEGPLRVVRGGVIWVNIRNIGWVEGSIAWVQDSRFGIAFRDEIDPKVARAPADSGDHLARFTRPPLPELSRAGVVRKI
jgi:PilZ domain